MEYKDYYKILGISRTATDDDIRKAFRKLARQYHPDVATNKTQAEEKFKEINEANEVLSDPTKRKRYDTLGANWKEQSAGAGRRPSPGGRSQWRQPGSNAEEFEFGGTGFSDFFEQFFGGSRGAGGFDPSGFQGASRGQDTEAEIMVTLQEVMHGSVRPISLRRNIPCPSCRGSGSVKGQPCPTCHGAGYSSKTDSYQVKIPAGVKEGQRLRLAGRGEAGSGTGAAGDLYLIVRYASDPDFVIEDSNLIHELDVAPWEAVLGAQVSVRTLEKSIQIKIPPGTQSGQKMRLKGHGFPQKEGEKGDLFVKIRVLLPKEISPKEQALWEELAKGSSFQPRGS
ncbi:MAG: Chaperone protein DnaJ [Verrucomicrobiales bacterium]|nr:Chaperone protein DnaJ [Verrucomicrobiales bacterium]MDB6129731.1 Chaperone protein DnaJ [Verrucomicrobiales bacterium]